MENKRVYYQRGLALKNISFQTRDYEFQELQCEFFI